MGLSDSRPDRRGMQARRVLGRERGVRISRSVERGMRRRRRRWGEVRERGSAPQREEERGRADTIGEPRARRVINNRATAPAPRGVPAYPSRSRFFLRLPPLSPSRSFRRWSPRARAPLETAYRSRQKTPGRPPALDRRRFAANEEDRRRGFRRERERGGVCGLHFREGFVLFTRIIAGIFPSCPEMMAIN